MLTFLFYTNFTTLFPYVANKCCIYNRSIPMIIKISQMCKVNIYPFSPDFGMDFM